MNIKTKKSNIFNSEINKSNDIKLKSINRKKYNTKGNTTVAGKKKSKITNKKISKKKKHSHGRTIKDHNHKEEHIIQIKNHDNNKIKNTYEENNKCDVNNLKRKNIDKKKTNALNGVYEQKETLENKMNKKKEANNKKLKFSKKKKIGLSITKNFDKTTHLSLYAEIKKTPKVSSNNVNENYNKSDRFDKNIIVKGENKKNSNSSNDTDSNDNNDNNRYKNSIADSNNVIPFDYEKLLVSKKNNSAIWISYIAYHLQKNNLDEARKVAERALKTIDIQEVDEKLNIYLCYLNMECVYGDKLYDIFKRASLCNNEKSIYLHMINILKNHNKLIELKEICEEAIKKFKYSKKIWSSYLENLHQTFKDEEYAHTILLKSLHSLPKRKHLNMIINAARFEYKYSNKERGKTYFEKLILEYPKRSDIWFTYLDIHINSLTKNKKKEKIKLSLNEIEFIRNIFERFISIKFKPRVMKIIFTKWVLFEKHHGSLHNQKIVQTKAHDYVESLNSEIENVHI